MYHFFFFFRYNDYTKDPLSRCNCTPPYSAENAISARCDLNPVNGTYPFAALGHRQHGATDMKVRNCVCVCIYTLFFKKHHHLFLNSFDLLKF